MLVRPCGDSRWILEEGTSQRSVLFVDYETGKTLLTSSPKFSPKDTYQ